MLGGQEMDDFWRNYLGNRYDENLDTARRLRAAGVDTVMKVYPGASHSFLEAVPVAAAAERAHVDAADWLRALLKRGD